jgi:hypothetical protein
MPHYVYEIPAGSAPIRQINGFPGYGEASAFANEERAKQSLQDAAMIVVVHAETSQEGDSAARRLQEQFEEARRSRPAPAARVSQFIREYGPAEGDERAQLPSLLE